MKSERARSAGVWPFVWTMLAVIAAIVVVPYAWREHERGLRERALAMSAVCPEKGRALTDRELSDAVLARIPTSYSSVDSFRAANPHCCEIVRWGELAEVSLKADEFLRQSARARLAGPYTVFVGAFYKDTTGARREQEYITDACGEVIRPAPGGGVL